MSHDSWEELSSRYRDGDLDPRELSLFEEHFEDCEICRGTVEIDTLFGEGLKTLLDSEYPATLESRTMAALPTVGTSAESDSPVEADVDDLGSRVGSWFRHGQFTIPVPVAMAAAVLLVALGALAVRVSSPIGTRNGNNSILVESLGGESEWIEADEAQAEVRSLLRRTRTLLLALSTARPDEGGRYHLEAEESLSRDLIQEVRLLESGNYLDDRTEILNLIQDLEVILLDVSTWQGEADADRLALLRGGINDRSLIYRLATYEPIVGGE